MQQTEWLCKTHENKAKFICRNQHCLDFDDYISCQGQCFPQHFDHTKQLIPYGLLHQELSSFYEKLKKNEHMLSCCTRQTLNKLLHMKMSIIRVLDQEIQLVSKMLKSQRRLPTLKQSLFLIKEVNFNDESIQFDADEWTKQLKDTLEKSVARARRNIQSIIQRQTDICEIGNSLSNSRKNVRYATSQSIEKQYELKIEGDASKVVRQLKSVPQHVTRLRIYLNEDTYGQDLSKFLESNYEFINSLRIYKESYCLMMEELVELKWLRKIRLNVWDKYFNKGEKKELLRQYRREMKNLDIFQVEDKIEGMIQAYGY